MIRGLNTTATYNVEDIIIALKEHRDRHIEDYTKAREVYFEEVRMRLIKFTDSAKTMQFRSDGFNVGLQAPVLKVEDYNKMIRMFDRMQETHIQLDAVTYSQIFDDEWDWITTAKLLNSTYSSKF